MTLKCQLWLWSDFTQCGGLAQGNPTKAYMGESRLPSFPAVVLRTEHNLREVYQGLQVKGKLVQTICPLVQRGEKNLPTNPREGFSIIFH